MFKLKFALVTFGTAIANNVVRQEQKKELEQKKTYQLFVLWQDTGSMSTKLKRQLFLYLITKTQC